MTLKELFLLIKHFWKLVVAVPLVCACACAVYLFAFSPSPEFSATSRIIVNSQVSAVAGIASSELRLAVNEDDELKATAKGDSGTMTVTITVTGKDIDTCVMLANSIAERAVATARDFYQEAEGSDYKTPFKAQVEPVDYYEAADSISDSEKSIGKSKLFIVTILCGLFLSLCIVVLIDLRRRFVKTPEGVQEAADLPVLETLPAKDGSRLLANVRFAVKNPSVADVLVVPIGDASAAQEACALLLKAADTEDVKGFSAETVNVLADDLTGAYRAQSASAVLVAARQWIDSLPQLESTVAELKLAGVEPAGIVFANAK